MNGPPWLNRLKKGGLKRLMIVSAMLVCLYLLDRGGAEMIQRFLFLPGDETAPRVLLVYLVDLNADDHQDAFLVTNQTQRILLNDGTGIFTVNQELRTWLLSGMARRWDRSFRSWQKSCLSVST